jgi:hypothetical protein
VKKLLVSTVAFTALFGSAALAQKTTTFSGITSTAAGIAIGETTTKEASVGDWMPARSVPYIMAFVSDRTYRRERNFRPGPFHELGEDDKVEWRR